MNDSIKEEELMAIVSRFLGTHQASLTPESVVVLISMRTLAAMMASSPVMFMPFSTLRMT